MSITVSECIIGISQQLSFDFPQIKLKSSNFQQGTRNDIMLCSQMSKWIYDTDSGVYIFIASSIAWILLADGTK